MKVNQTTFSFGSGGNVLTDSTNITPQDRYNLKQNHTKSSSNSKKKLTKEKSKDGSFADVFTPQKDGKSTLTTGCQTDIILENEEDAFAILNEEWEIIAKEREKKLKTLLEENEELTEQVNQLEEIYKQAKELASLAQIPTEEIDMKKFKALDVNENVSLSKTEPKSDYTQKRTTQHQNSFDAKTIDKASKRKNSSKKSKRKSSDENNIFGSSRLDQIYVDENPTVLSTMRVTKNVYTQTESSFSHTFSSRDKITEETLTNEYASPLYWETLSYKRKHAIDETEVENARLKAYVKLLEEVAIEAKEIASLLESLVTEED